MKRSRLSELMCQAEETLCFIYTLMMATFYSAFLSNGYVKAGTDKGVLYIYLAGTFCILGMIFYILYIAGKLRISGLAIGVDKPDRSDVFMLVYFLTINISFYFSFNRRAALTGEGGWYQGYLTSIFLVISYFLISNTLYVFTIVVL